MYIQINKPAGSFHSAWLDGLLLFGNNSNEWLDQQLNKLLTQINVACKL